MTFVRTLLLASALAVPLTVAHVVTHQVTAEAAAKKGKSAKKAKKSKPGAYKHCGTFMYRKGGKCLDARAKRG